MEVDHIKPLRLMVDELLENRGLAYDLDNLQTLCRSCHFSKTAKENTKHPLSPRAVVEVREWLTVT